MKPILEIQHISKKYKLRGQETPYLTLRDALLGKHKPQETKEFWALNDVSFNVYPGESIGIIGRNGAGKSTLLKILSRITPPTKGKIISRGRIASLLEVGTGFHAELTGRENIFLNGSILGLRKQEIKAKFDEIVDFAGVEKFIDTPLKHYSSGMQLRLAFAVAAHLEPEILIIDEVLAVGDAEFQKKSLGKMEEVTKQGRTVLFVSHNMAAVQNLCSKGVLLNEGKVVLHDEINNVINKYNMPNRNKSKINGIFDLVNHTNKKYHNNFGLQKIELYNNDKLSENFKTGDKLLIKIFYKLKDIHNHIKIGLVFKNEKQINLIGFNNEHIGKKIYNTQENGIINVTINNLLFFGDHKISVDLFFGDGITNYDIIEDAFSFFLHKTDVYNSNNILNQEINLFFQDKISINIE